MLRNFFVISVRSQKVWLKTTRTLCIRKYKLPGSTDMLNSKYIPFLESKRMKNSLSDKKSNRKDLTLIEEDSAKKLANALKCKIYDAKILVIRHPSIFIENLNSIISKIDYLTDKNISLVYIHKNVSILHLPMDILHERWNEISKWNLPEDCIQECLPFLNLPTDKLILVTQLFEKEKDTVPLGNRLIYLAKCLRCSINELSQKLSECEFVLRRDWNLLITTLRTYKEFNVKNRDILNDLVCLNISIDTIRSRFEEAKSKKVHHLGPWLTRSTDKVFKKFIELHLDEIQLLAPFTTRTEYLMNKLNLTPVQMKELEKKRPTLFSNNTRINTRMLILRTQFFLDIGITPVEIINQPDVYICNIDLLKERYKALQRVGVHRPTLHLLFKSKKQFDKFISYKLSEQNK